MRAVHPVDPPDPLLGDPQGGGQVQVDQHRGALQVDCFADRVRAQPDRPVAGVAGQQVGDLPLAVGVGPRPVHDPELVAAGQGVEELADLVQGDRVQVEGQHPIGLLVQVQDQLRLAGLSRGRHPLGSIQDLPVQVVVAGHRLGPRGVVGQPVGQVAAQGDPGAGQGLGAGQHVPGLRPGQRGQVLERQRGGGAGHMLDQGGPGGAHHLGDLVGGQRRSRAQRSAQHGRVVEESLRVRGQPPDPGHPPQLGGQVADLTCEQRIRVGVGGGVDVDVVGGVATRPVVGVAVAAGFPVDQLVEHSFGAPHREPLQLVTHRPGLGVGQRPAAGQSVQRVDRGVVEVVRAEQAHQGSQVRAAPTDRGGGEQQHMIGAVLQQPGGSFGVVEEVVRLVGGQHLGGGHRLHTQGVVAGQHPVGHRLQVQPAAEGVSDGLCKGVAATLGS